MRKSTTMARVSSREQQETGYSLDSQETLLVDYAGNKEFEVDRKFRITESASKSQARKLFAEMLAYTRKEGVDVILCEKIDRLTRNLKDAAIIDDWVHEKEGREVHFVKENFILSSKTRAHENFVWDMKVAAARFYTNNLSEEVKKGQAEKIVQGWLPTKPPLGYKTIGEKGHKIHVVDEEKAPYLRKAFELYATGNYSLEALREQLANEGLRTRGGSKLSKSRMADIMGDPFYMGSMRWNDFVYDHGKHEPLVSKELFEKVQLMLKGKSAPHHNRHLFAFTKMIHCGGCERIMSGYISKDGVRYECKHAKLCSERGTTREDRIVSKLIGTFTLFEQMTEKESKELFAKIRGDHQSEADYKAAALHSLQTRYNSLQRQLDILYDDRLAENISQERWQSKQKTINEEQESIRDEMAKMKSEETKYFEIYIYVLDLARRARKLYMKGTPEERRLIIQHLFSYLIIKDKETDWKAKAPIEKLSKRVQEKIDAQKKLERSQNGSTKGRSRAVDPTFSPLLRG